jgi:hypothetical protein
MSDASRLAWHRSSYCSHDSCVEVARQGNQVFLRDSKAQDGPMLAFRHAEWADFIEGVRRGEFDVPFKTP